MLKRWARTRTFLAVLPVLPLPSLFHQTSTWRGNKFGGFFSPTERLGIATRAGSLVMFQVIWQLEAFQGRPNQHEKDETHKSQKLQNAFALQRSPKNQYDKSGTLFVSIIYDICFKGSASGLAQKLCSLTAQDTSNI